MGCGPPRKPLKFTYYWNLWSIAVQIVAAFALIVESAKHPISGTHRGQTVRESAAANSSGIISASVYFPSSHRSSSSSSSSSSAGGGQRIVRYYSLLGRCPESHVRMTSTHVDCTALDSDDPYTRFGAVSASFGSQLRLQSALSRTFLCFSRVGKLTVKHTGNSRNCLLREVLSADRAFVEFQSVHNSSWFVGFNSRGRRLVGDHWMAKPRLRKCFQFTKRSFPYLSPVESKEDIRRHRRARPHRHHSSKKIADKTRT